MLVTCDRKLASVIHFSANVLTVIWFLVRVPVLSVAKSVSYNKTYKIIVYLKGKLTDRAYRKISVNKYELSCTETLPSVSTPCKSLTRTFCAAIRLAAIDNLTTRQHEQRALGPNEHAHSNVTTEGSPSGTNATRILHSIQVLLAGHPRCTLTIPRM